MYLDLGRDSHCHCSQVHRLRRMYLDLVRSTWGARALDRLAAAAAAAAERAAALGLPALASEADRDRARELAVAEAARRLRERQARAQLKQGACGV